MEKYEYLYIVGEGYGLGRTYGKVVKAVNKETGQFVAIKKFKDTEENQTVKRTALREIRILKMMKHPNIVSLLEVYHKNKRIYLVFEFVDSTILQEIEKRPSGLDSQMVKKLLLQILLSINHCHSSGVIHRDIKPENLLVSSKGLLKLCDFGFARIFKQSVKMTEYVSTRWYRAPELLVGGKDYRLPVDIWSVGCVLFEMITGQPLFPGVNDADTLFKIIKVRGQLTEELEEEMKANVEYNGLKVCFK
jgi:cyclin-dependent kinase-like